MFRICCLDVLVFRKCRIKRSFFILKKTQSKETSSFATIFLACQRFLKLDQEEKKILHFLGGLKAILSSSLKFISDHFTNRYWGPLSSALRPKGNVENWTGLPNGAINSPQQSKIAQDTIDFHINLAPLVCVFSEGRQTAKSNRALKTDKCPP